MENIFAPGGILAQRLPGYELRAGQLEMARAVATALDGGALAVEAGTGIGKTLAYLVPAVLCGRKIVVSTGTLNLQDQILQKEIPFIREHIAPHLQSVCVKGRQNYLCLYRWKQHAVSRQSHLFADDDFGVDRVRDWLSETETGDRAELHWLPDDSPFWHAVSSSTSKCLGIHCPEGPSCFINKLRRTAGKADILIVNHHLFFSDLALRRFGFAEVLPRYESVIFDEAHHLENVATRYFGTSFSQYQLLDLVQDIEKTAEERLPDRDRARIIQLARALASEAETFAGIFPREKGRFPLLEFIESSASWESAVNALADRFAGLSLELEKLEPVSDIWTGMVRRAQDLYNSLETIHEGLDSASVYWFERRERTIALSASPIEVAPLLQEHFFGQVRSVVFTSATLTTGGDFSYFSNRLGLPDETEYLELKTPYDWQGKTLLYVPENSFPQPGSPLFQEKAQKRIHEIIQAVGGRALVLFTSQSAMLATRDFLEGQLDFPLFMQGEAPRSVLLEMFKKETHSVLLAVASFWEGVDVPGEALSAVIIDKLPFEVPSDPVIMARVNRVKEEGGNPFMDFQVPRAILTLRQGLGRLLRSASDNGILAVLDVRLFTKQYGGIFRKSLPPSTVTRDVDDLRLFFSED
ncbi:MAG: ATP-dependent DNA helicase [Proteobacteria bacterium]|nr:ATP-dependent DNA helicase [Pseudomonadota bacterium]MBU1708487.1 ATP-dependent DNA helicase [Pseudomonadota bacterium]